jgi:hypothetical protein
MQGTRSLQQEMWDLGSGRGKNNSKADTGEEFRKTGVAETCEPSRRSVVVVFVVLTTEKLLGQVKSVREQARAGIRVSWYA